MPSRQLAVAMQGERSAISKPIPLPAPFGGMNTRDGVANLRPEEARHLENWNPVGAAVEMRGGMLTHSNTAAGAVAVDTLAVWEGTAGKKLIAIAGGTVYDVTTVTPSTISAAGYTDSRFQTDVYSGFLFGVNGSETPWRYDGTTFGATGFTGVTLTNLVNVAKVRDRLWFCENNSADVWYGSLGGVTGALTKFDLSQVSGGGFCMAIGAHSMDAGAGPDDYTVFVMSTGEILIYTGDPSSTFTKVGNYRMPPPVGRQCLVQIGGPIAVVTRMGLIPIQAAATGTAFDVMALGAFGKVAPTLKTDAETYGSLKGWSVRFWNGLVIVNVPILDGMSSKQWVYNALTGAWTTWTRIPAASIVAYDSDLYVGGWSDGIVHGLTGNDDNGTAIPLVMRQAYISQPTGNKIKATALRFDFELAGELSGKLGVDVDYIEREITAPSVTLASSFNTTPWGSSWGSPWSTANQYKPAWQSVYGEGRALGLAARMTASARTMKWLGTQMLTQGSGIL